MRYVVLVLLLAGCASFEGKGLVPGQSTVADVERVMGRAQEKRAGAAGETVYFFPRIPWGYQTYAARIAPDGRLIALEQRLTEDNIKKIKPEITRGEQVRDLLGPPYEPLKQARTGKEMWTYPMRIAGYPTPKWFLVYIGPDGVVSDTYLIDDPQYAYPDSNAPPT